MSHPPSTGQVNGYRAANGHRPGGGQYATGAPRPRPIAQARPQHRVIAGGVITAAGPLTVGGGPACRCVLADGTGELDLLFLGRTAVYGLVTGVGCVIEGTAARRNGRLVVWNPRYWLAPGAALAGLHNGQARVTVTPRNNPVTSGR